MDKSIDIHRVKNKNTDAHHVRNKSTNTHRVKKRAVDLLVHLLLAVLAVVWLLPIVWIILISFRKEPGAYTSTFLPKSYTLANYVKLFTDRTLLDFPRMFSNTLIIAIFCCLISTFFVVSVAFALSRMRFRFRKVFMNMAMILGLFPGFMAMVAQYYLLKQMGLTEGSAIRIGLILAYSACSGLGFQTMKGYLDTIPASIDEAAMIDGATRWQIFTKIILPLSRPILIYTVLTSFMAPWVDFIFASVICRANADQYTVAIGLWEMLSKEYIYQWYTCFAAGAVIVSIPIAALFIIMQRFYVEGMSGAIKG